MVLAKLIEVSLPLDAINAAASREKSIRHGHPSTLHLWWARRPLAAARAVLFSQLVDDPSFHPEQFPTQETQDAERQRLHDLLSELVVWENSNNEELLAQARDEICKSNGGELPAVVDPFAGGGTIPLEAQRLGLEAHASDLNPVAVLINKALIEIPPKFAGQAPVNPDAEARTTGWHGAEGLAEDVRRYGQWMRDEAFRRIGHLYPKVKAEDGTEHTVIAWIWARTVRSPNPANPIETPLVRSWWLSKKKGKEAYVVPHIEDGQVRYEVRHDRFGPTGPEVGTMTGGKGTAVGDGVPISNAYIREEAQAGRLGADLIAVVAEGKRGRLYVSPSAVQEEAADVERPDDVPAEQVPHPNHDVDRLPMYGMPTWADAFTNRQLVALTTLSDLVGEARERALQDAQAAGLPEGERLEDGGTGAAAYADAISVYLGLAVSRLSDRCSSLCSWDSSRESVRNVFARQAIPMVWDYVEPNLFSSSSGNFMGQVTWVAEVIESAPATSEGLANQVDAGNRLYDGFVVSTDPPYYDNIGYSDLSDYFYVWQRRALRTVLPSVFGTVLTPKADELVANPYRHDGKKGAEEFFVSGFNEVFSRIRRSARPDVPLTVYYAYKQQATNGDDTASTGWETLLDGLIHTGWEITATWPMRSELSNRMIGSGANALASSIVLACRPRPATAPSISRRDFTGILRDELPEALRRLKQATIAPVDLAQAAIGPGMAVFSRYGRVREVDGSDMTVREALGIINSELAEVLEEGVVDADNDTRFAIKWYQTYGWKSESSGTAIQLGDSTGTTIEALQRGGIFEAKAGKARLIRPAELSGQEDWDPLVDDRLSLWEATVRLAGILATKGAEVAAGLFPAVDHRVGLGPVQDLAYLLFHQAERNGDTQDALLFNGLVTAWNEVATEAHRQSEQQTRHGGRQVQGEFDIRA